MEQVDSSFRDLVNAVILRAVQDARLESLSLNSSSVDRNKIKAEAVSDIKSEDFQYMCECVGKDCSVIRRELVVN